MQELAKVLSNCYQISRQDQSSLEVAIKPNPTWPFFQGHFPQKPILPGYAIAEISVFLCNLLTGNNGKLLKLHTMRMRKPVQPEDNLQVVVEMLPNERRYNLTWHLYNPEKSLLASIDLETT